MLLRKLSGITVLLKDGGMWCEYCWKGYPNRANQNSKHKIQQARMDGGHRIQTMEKPLHPQV